MNDNTDNTGRTPVKKQWVAVIPLAVAAVVIALTLAGVTGQNAIRNDAIRQASTALSHVLPQGWAFFTKPPQTPRYRLYTVDDTGALVDEVAKHSVDHTALYGWNRSYRNFAAERELVERVLADADLHDCSDGNIEDCFATLDIDAPEHETPHFAAEPELCGKFFVSVADPVPWEWRDLVDGRVRVTGVTTLEISC